MPDIKNQFTGGKMNKDLDERLVPKGQYRDAMNIQVSTSEGSEVGTVQNILGNAQVSLLNGFTLPLESKTIGCVADEKNDALYYLVWSNDANYIIEYIRGNDFATPVFTDTKHVLEFNFDTSVTGINIIDDMIFWTDNKTEPKKINIVRCKQGTIDFVQHTRLINESQNILLIDNVDIETKHITVIKKCPKTALKLNLKTAREIDKIYTGVITITNFNELNVVPENIHPFGGDLVPAANGNVINSLNYSSFVNVIYTQNAPINDRFDFDGLTTEDGSNEFSVKIMNGIDQLGNEVPLSKINEQGGLNGWHHASATYGGGPNNGDTNKTNIAIGTKVVLKPYDGVNPPGLPVTDYVIKGEITDRFPSFTKYGNSTNAILQPQFNTDDYAVDIKITAIDGTPPSVPDGETELKYVIDLFDDTEKLFEFKFPRFSYRYKYSDGEYSTFAPFTRVAFQPGPFDYHPRKGYNLGMTNRIQSVDLYGLVTSKTPEDVESIDILFKDEPSPSIYVVDTIRKDDVAIFGSVNKWDSILNGGVNSFYNIKKETINSIVPSNQLLRPWDNVPRKALAQDITGNRIVYANYIQNYDLKKDGKNFVPNFTVNFVNDAYRVDLLTGWTKTSGADKSIKSLREYQLGVVFVDKYGRETPVISNESGTIKLEKEEADKYNRLQVNLGNVADGYPSSNENHLRYFKFYIKETSGEYYNMAMDRWYDAEDGNIWLAFPSSDRNKLDIDSFLILKKGSDESELVKDPARYKVIAIENEAPDYIKTRKTLTARVVHSFSSANPGAFGNSISNGPAQGRNEIEINYKAFSQTSGLHLDEYTGGELYIEFGNAGGQFSDRYRISGIEHDNGTVLSGSGANVVTTTFDDAKYYITLADNLGSDVNFITDDPSGINSSLIENGTVVNIYKYEVTNSPKFDGRFFVKIYSDDVFSSNIGKSFEEGLDFRVLNSKKVFYMHPEHRRMHTENHDYFLTKGEFSTLGDDVDEFLQDPSLTAWGYYSVPEFASMAMFFRRYARGLSENSNSNYMSGSDWNWSSPSIDSGKWPLLAHLKLGTNGVSAPAISGALDRTYLNEEWTPADNWAEEWGGSNTSPSANSRGINAGMTNSFYYEGFNTGPTFNRHIYEKHTQETTDQNSRDTEVWFIDGSDFAGVGNLSDENTLSWNPAHYEHQREYFTGVAVPLYTGPNSGPMGSAIYGDNLSFTSDELAAGAGSADGTAQGFYDFYTRRNQGIVGKGNDTHEMNLSFGGIIGATNAQQTDNFFNIGNYGVGSGASLNSRYSDLENFIQNFNSGIKFRWKQDPTGQVYTIGITSYQNQFRHSSVRTHGDWLGHPTYPTGVNYGVTAMNNPSWGSIVSQTLQPSYFTGPISIEEQVLGGNSMAENLSFNFSKKYKISDISPDYNSSSWYPLTDGEITNGYTIHLTCCDSSGSTTGTVTAAGTTIALDLEIYVTSLTGAIGNPHGDAYASSTLLVGMALESYTLTGTTALTTVASNLGSSAQEFLVIRDIQIETNTTTNISFYKLILGGYRKALTTTDHALAITPSKRPQAGELFKFVQVGMNGYSPNSEFNINTMAFEEGTFGAVGAVGYDLEFVEFIEPEEVLSENPAVWETEPKDIKELDIYYEASPSIPMVIDEETIESAFPVNSYFQNPANLLMYAVDYDGSNLIMSSNPPPATTYAAAFSGVTFPLSVSVFRPDGITFYISILSITDIGTNALVEFNPKLYNLNYDLDWHNCYSFGNGVESNRIRDNFNLPFITNGVKVSTTLEHEYREEHRKYGLIYSGIYNSTSGVNNLNQFIQAEKITKDINPTYGSIQKLKAGWGQRGDLVALCEDRVLKILANKDALFNADGNTNVTATNKVLGTATPYSGEYGISTNPESFASEAYRAYFTDKVRGKVMRLSMDGLTPISDAGMKDWFRDNLKLVNTAIGSYDDKKDQYNLTLANKSDVYNVTFKSTLGAVYNMAPSTPTQLQLSASHTVGFKGNFTSNAPNGCAGPYVANRLFRAEQGIFNVGDAISGRGIPIGTTIVSIFQDVTLAYYIYELSQDPIGVSSSHDPYSCEDKSLSALARPLGIQGDQCATCWDVVVSKSTTNDPVKTITYKEDVRGWVSFKSFLPEQALSMANDYYTFDKGRLWKHHDETVGRNTFYGIHSEKDYSTVNVIINQAPGTVKSFNTLNYEGSKSRVVANTLDDQYYNLASKTGWYVDSIFTNKETGSLEEFIEKEGKWFNYIKGNPALHGDGQEWDETTNANIMINPDGESSWDQASLAIQGLGMYGTMILGCTDASALNYDSSANTDDGSCTYQVVPVYGCMDLTACNYNPLADTSTPQSCNYTTCAGCLDPLATNYDAAFTINNQSACIFCVDGCMDATQFNYNALATCDDGSCIPFTYGCTDSNAQNFNALANTDDGSCIYPPVCISGCTQGSTQLGNQIYSNFDPANTCDCDGVPGGTANHCCVPCVYGCTIPGNINYNNLATCENASCIPTVYGCTDPTAVNFNIAANNDDSSCLYAGCTDPTATNYDANAYWAFDDGSCTYPTPGCNLTPSFGTLMQPGTQTPYLGFALSPNLHTIQIVTNGLCNTPINWSLVNANGDVMTSSFNAYPNFTFFQIYSLPNFIGDGNYTFKAIQSSSGLGPNGSNIEETVSLVFGCIDNSFGNYNSNANISDGTCA
tara:strand:+ start:15 stop:8012 length:7998 start_codon:yes stop_codon:yes gene_type:complete